MICFKRCRSYLRRGTKHPLMCEVQLMLLAAKVHADAPRCECAPPACECAPPACPPREGCAPSACLRCSSPASAVASDDSCTIQSLLCPVRCCQPRPFRTSARLATTIYTPCVRSRPRCCLVDLCSRGQQRRGFSLACRRMLLLQCVVSMTIP